MNKLNNFNSRLIQCIYEWSIDNNFTPYISIDYSEYSDKLPIFKDKISNNYLTLNIGPTSVRNLIISDDEIIFTARFNRIPLDFNISIEHIRMIYPMEDPTMVVSLPKLTKTTPENKPFDRDPRKLITLKIVK